MMSLFSFSTPCIHQKATGLRIDIFHAANLFVNPPGGSESDQWHETGLFL